MMAAQQRSSRRNRAGEATRQRIMQAAMTLVADEGYSALTIARVAAEAGVTTSSVRNQFASKDEILAEAVEASLDDWRHQSIIWQPPSRSGTVEERIRTRLEAAVETARRSQADWWRVGMIVALLEPSPELTAQRVFMRVLREAGLANWEWLQTLVPEALARQPILMNTLTQGYLAAVNGMFIALRADPGLATRPVVEALSIGLARLGDAWAAHVDDVAAELRVPERPIGADPLSMAASTPRERLVIAAAQLAAERGYRGATLEAICERAGLPAGTPYREFQGKADLFEQVIRTSMDLRWSQVGQAEPDVPWARAMESWLAVGPSSGDPRTRHFQRIGFMLVLERSDDGLPARNQYLAVRTEALEWTRRWFAEALPIHVTPSGDDLDRMLSLLSVTLADGFLFSRLADPGGWTVNAYRVFTTGLFEAIVSACQGAGAK